MINSRQKRPTDLNTLTLMFFLLILSEEELLRLCAEFRRRVEEEDAHEVA